MNTPVLVVGEALIDMVEGVPHVGGSPLNVAVGLARLGHTTHFAGRFGRDEFGDLISQHLRTNGVHSLLPADSNPTSMATTTLDADGAASYEFQLHWELPDLTNTLPGAMEGARALHTGSLAAILQPGAARVIDAVMAARQAGLLVSFDPNCRPSITTDNSTTAQAVEALVKHSHIVKASHEDLEWLYPTRSVEASAMAWRQLGPALVVVTLGPRGAIAFFDGGPCSIDAPRVSIVDTVGAGDSFMAALLSGILELGDQPLRALSPTAVQSVIQRAGSAAAITIARRGANPPTREQLDLSTAPQSSPSRINYGFH